MTTVTGAVALPLKGALSVGIFRTNGTGSFRRICVLYFAESRLTQIRFKLVALVVRIIAHFVGNFARDQIAGFQIQRLGFSRNERVIDQFVERKFYGVKNFCLRFVKREFVFRLQNPER